MGSGMEIEENTHCARNACNSIRSAVRRERARARTSGLRVSRPCAHALKVLESGGCAAGHTAATRCREQGLCKGEDSVGSAAGDGSPCRRSASSKVVGKCAYGVRENGCHVQMKYARATQTEVGEAQCVGRCIAAPNSRRCSCLRVVHAVGSSTVAGSDRGGTR